MTCDPGIQRVVYAVRYHPLGLGQGFSTSALLVFWTRYFFVEEAALYIERWLAELPLLTPNPTPLIIIKNVSRHCQAKLPPRWDPLGYCLVENDLFLRKNISWNYFFVITAGRRERRTSLMVGGVPVRVLVVPRNTLDTKEEKLDKPGTVQKELIWGWAWPFSPSLFLWRAYQFLLLYSVLFSHTHFLSPHLPTI